MPDSCKRSEHNGKAQQAFEHTSLPDTLFGSTKANSADPPLLAEKNLKTYRSRRNIRFKNGV